jgi:hypothetical protein
MANLKNKILVINLTFIFIMFLSYLDWWQGDPAIYHIYAKNIYEGKGLVFNNTFSTGATSPLWAVIMSAGYFFSNPVIISKIFIAVLLGWFVFLFKDFTFFTSAILFFITKPAMLGYEIALFFFLIGLAWYYREERFLPFILMLIPFGRPEGVLIVLFFVWHRKNYWLLLSLVPFVMYSGISYLLTNTLSNSAAGRVQYLLQEGDLFSRRYWFWLLPMIVILTERYHKIITSRRIAYLGLLLLLIPVYDSFSKIHQLTFDTVTQKGIENYIKDNGRIFTLEAPIKYRVDNEVITMDGITDNTVWKYKNINECIKEEGFEYIILCDIEQHRAQTRSINLSGYKLIAVNNNRKFHADWSRIYKK